jgi:hypothetical protein
MENHVDLTHTALTFPDLASGHDLEAGSNLKCLACETECLQCHHTCVDCIAVCSKDHC